MGNSSSCSPYGSNAGLVDRMIGDAFDVCKHLYDNMEDIHAVAGAIKVSDIGTPFLASRSVVQDVSVNGLNSTKLTYFEDLNIDYRNIIGSHVMLIGSSGAHYFGDSGAFKYNVTADGINITLPAGAPAELANALGQWFIIYGI